jgi:DNA-binding IclR family transcriptional regulator
MSFTDSEDFPPQIFGAAKREVGAPGKVVGAVVMAAKILRHLSESTEPLPSNRIARDLGINPSSCFNLLKTMEREGLTYCDPETKRHRLGFLLVELGSGALAHLGYRELIHPHIEGIATKHRATATLWLRTGYDRVRLVDLVDGGGPIKIAMSIGQRLPVLAGALGRCFAGGGEFDRETLKRLYAKVRNIEPVSFDEFLRESNLAAERGYGVDAGHFAGGVTAVSAPVFDPTGRIVMAISVVDFLNNADPERVASIGEDAKQAAAMVSHKLANAPELIPGERM